MKNRFKLIAAISLATALPQVAHAEGNAQAGLRISLTVPEICQLETSGLVIDQADNQARASVFELCNSGRGFRVLASHRALQAGEHVQVSYAGQVTELDASGVSEIAYRQGPTVGEVPVLFQTDGLVQGLAISLGMTAI